MMNQEQIAAMRAEQPNHYGQRLPTIDELRATILSQAAEIERLKSGIPWRDGPPPAEWRDGRQVLVMRDDCAFIVQWDDDFEWFSDPTWFGDDKITHHAAIDKPGETL